MDHILLLADKLTEAVAVNGNGSAEGDLHVLPEKIEDVEALLENIDKTELSKSSVGSTSFTVNRQYLQALKAIHQFQEKFKGETTQHHRHLRRLLLAPLKTHEQFLQELHAQLSDSELFRNEAYLRKAQEATDLRLQELNRLSSDVKSTLAGWQCRSAATILEEAWNQEWKRLVEEKAKSVQQKINDELKFYTGVYQRSTSTISGPEKDIVRVHPEDFLNLRIAAPEASSKPNPPKNDSVAQKFVEVVNALQLHVDAVENSQSTMKSLAEDREQLLHSQTESLKKKDGNSIFAVIPDQVDYVVHGLNVSDLETLDSVWAVVDKLLLALKFMEVKTLSKSISSKQLRLYTTRMTHLLHELKANSLVQSAGGSSLLNLIEVMTAANQRLCKRGGQMLFRQESISNLVDFEAAVPQIKKEVEDVVNRYVQALQKGDDVSAEALFEERNALVLVAEKYCNRLSQITKKNKAPNQQQQIEKDSDDELIENPGDTNNFHTVHWKDLWILASEHTEEHHHVVADELQFRTALTTLDHYAAAVQVFLRLRESEASNKEQFAAEMDRFRTNAQHILRQLGLVDQLGLKVVEEFRQHAKLSVKEVEAACEAVLVEVGERLVELGVAQTLSEDTEKLLADDSSSSDLENLIRRKFAMEAVLKKWNEHLDVRCFHFQTLLSQQLETIDKDIQDALQRPLKDAESKKLETQQMLLQETASLNNQIMIAISGNSSLDDIRAILLASVRHEFQQRLTAAPSSDLQQSQLAIQNVQQHLVNLLQQIVSTKQFTVFMESLLPEVSPSAWNEVAEVSTVLKVLQAVNAVLVNTKPNESFRRAEERLSRDVEKLYAVSAFMEGVRHQIQEVSFEVHVWNVERDTRRGMPLDAQVTSSEELLTRLDRAGSTLTQMQSTVSTVEALLAQVSIAVPQETQDNMFQLRNAFASVEKQLVLFKTQTQQDIDQWEAQQKVFGRLLTYLKKTSKTVKLTQEMIDLLTQEPDRVRVLQKVFERVDGFRKEYSELRSSVIAVPQLSKQLDNLLRAQNELTSAGERVQRMLSEHASANRAVQHLCTSLTTVASELDVCEKALFDRAVSDVTAADVESYYKQRAPTLERKLEAARKDVEKQKYHQERLQFLLRNCEAKWKLLGHLVETAVGSHKKRADEQATVKQSQLDLEGGYVRLQMSSQTIRSSQQETTDPNFLQRVEDFFRQVVALNGKLFQQKIILYDTSKASLQPEELNTILKKVQQTVSATKHVLRRRIQTHVESLLPHLRDAEEPKEPSPDDSPLSHWHKFCMHWFRRLAEVSSGQQQNGHDDCLAFLEMASLWEQYLMYFMEVQEESASSIRLGHSWGCVKDSMELLNNAAEQQLQIRLHRELASRNFTSAVEQMRRHQSMWNCDQDNKASLQKIFTLFHMTEVLLKEAKFQHEDFLRARQGFHGELEEEKQLVEQWNETCERVATLCGHVNRIVDWARKYSAGCVKLEAFFDTAKNFLPRLKSRAVVLTDRRLILSMLHGKREEVATPDIDQPLPQELCPLDAAAIQARLQLLHEALHLTDMTISRWEKSVSSCLETFHTWLAESVALRADLEEVSRQAEKTLLLKTEKDKDDVEARVQNINERVTEWVHRSRHTHHLMDKAIVREMRPLQRDVLHLVRYLETLQQKRHFMQDIVRECERVWQSGELALLSRALPPFLQL